MPCHAMPCFTGRPCEDTITLLVQWRNLADGSLGTASYTAGWISPKADCHTQQYMHYLGRSGEVRSWACIVPS